MLMFDDISFIILGRTRVGNSNLSSTQVFHVPLNVSGLGKRPPCPINGVNFQSTCIMRCVRLYKLLYVSYVSYVRIRIHFCSIIFFCPLPIKLVHARSGIDLGKPASLRPPTGSGMSCTGAICGSSDEDRLKSLEGKHLGTFL